MLSNRQLFLRHVAQTSAGSLQFEIDRAEGVYFYGADGKQYMDLVSGVAVSALGHGHPNVVRAVQKQAGQYLHAMVYGEFIQSPQVRYAQWLSDRLPGSLDNVFFVNSGSEAIDGAIKLARRSTGRTGIRAFIDAYHGGTLGAFSLLGHQGARSGALPLLPGVKHLRFNVPGDLERIDESVAAVFVEPIQAEAGIVEPEDGFLSRLRERCDETGALLVFDEIQTGMGRTGKLMAFEHYGVVPDILCLAKSFGGGMPLGAFIARKSLMESLTHDPPLGHITTFGGHPVCCAAALAAQQTVEDQLLMDHATAMEEYYRNNLLHPHIEGLRGKGLFLAAVLKGGLSVSRFIDAAYRHGLIIDQFLFCADAFRIAPPLIISKAEAEESVKRIVAALNELG